MKKIAPSILSADFYRLGEEIENAMNLKADWMHIDVMDGHFVPPITYGSKIVEDIKNNNKNVFCDVHLMVTNPMDLVMQFVQAGADLINFHSEAVFHGDRIVNFIKENKKMAGVTINPSTPVELIKHYLSIVDLVLVMSVNPGYGGQKFIDYSYDKVKELREIREKNGYNFLIEIDGGIGLNNIENALSYGVDVVVAGSSFFKNSPENKKKLVEIIHNFEN
jgi:ribulose-phosphate 3-epimerase